MNHTEQILGFTIIKEQLQEFANTRQAKEQLSKLSPYLEEGELRKNMRETTQARSLMELLGTPPIPVMEKTEEYLEGAMKGELLMPENIEEVGFFLTAVKRMKDYLRRGMEHQNSLAFYHENLQELPELATEIARAIRGGRVDDYASPYLADKRRNLTLLEEKIQNKAESILRSNKNYMSDSYVVTRNGHICLPVKKDAKSKIPGNVIDQSPTKMTFFIEPASVAALSAEAENLRIEEDTEVRRILYTLAAMIAENEAVIKENIRVMVRLDFFFAKGKLSMAENAVEPSLHLERSLMIKAGRHPLLKEELCVPLDFAMEEGKRGVIITGPNTGGKTVSIKTVGLFSMMAGSGLHVPCKEASICMFNQIYCDIGDGQDMTDNLSTFSAHIKGILAILERVTKESLVVMDELGSGTDPLEGMGIAIAILEKLRELGCMYLVTTHYPEVKEYANRHHEILNARMAFDREQLKPLYRMEIGSAGQSCALYIAKKLGLPDDMLRVAAREAYGEEASSLELGLGLKEKECSSAAREDYLHPTLKRQPAPRLVPLTRKEKVSFAPHFHRGDSVIVSPEQRIGIVVKEDDPNGNVLVQIQKEKILIHYKRLKLKVAASELYPEDYDFSIIFDSVEVRKGRHEMERKYIEGRILNIEE